MANEDLIKQVMTSSKCDICARTYEEEDIIIIGNIEETWILQIYCRSCHSQTLLAATIDDQEETTRKEAVTDLLTGEVKKFQNIVITVNDVLDMCLFLRGYEGSITDLLE